MRFLLYNIRYATGSGWDYHLPFPYSGYLRRTRGNLRKIAEFVKSERPDVIGLVEVDNGSYRSEKANQAAVIANELGHTHVYESKYAQSSVLHRMPVLREQGNAFITNQTIEARDFQYFSEGMKRLVIKLEFEAFVIFLVHLSLKYRHRQYQLSSLYSMFTEVRKPMIVAGDFNAFWGHRELDLFMAASGLLNANIHAAPTFPSRRPRRQLDFILHSPAIRVTNFRVSNVKYSDHMPLICDFEIGNGAA
ncbi:MAG TPA: endonuclease/exonuclease/phosphatase family protein [Candidatus Hydrogenedentes bacterium]|nr:endonuclease/exonuclease/phosphatase family protein [Candidatus Hydrogenedentota bacterium]HQH69799.1 endonuclease/exonuclease/phosphatase family protein [Candidatus Hydrogenedentota bacterium]